jgi:hypothetical protein
MRYFLVKNVDGFDSNDLEKARQILPRSEILQPALFARKLLAEFNLKIPNPSQRVARRDQQIVHKLSTARLRAKKFITDL